MKKTIFAALMGAILFVSPTFGQDDMREKFNFGVKAGVNLANIWDKESNGFEATSKLGFAGGIYATIPLGRLFAIQPEVMFSQKGFKGTGSVLTIPYEMKRTSNYLDIPLLLAIRPVDFISIVVGPQFSFLLSQKNALSFGESGIANNEQFENDNWRKNMLGLHAGLDLNFRHFVVSPRVSMDFQDNKGDGSSTDPRYKNFVAQLTLGYRF